MKIIRVKNIYSQHLISMIINVRLTDDIDTVGVSRKELDKVLSAAHEIKISSDSINLFTIGIKYIEKNNQQFNKISSFNCFMHMEAVVEIDA